MMEFTWSDGPSLLIDFLNLLVRFMGIIVWPGAIAFIVWLFRKPLSELIPNLTEFNGFGLSAKVQSLRQEVQRGQELDANLREANLLIARGQYSMARRKLEMVVQRFPESTEAKIDLANALAYAGTEGKMAKEYDLPSLDQSIRVLEGVLSTDPQNGRAAYNLACDLATYRAGQMAKGAQDKAGEEGLKYSLTDVLRALDDAIFLDCTSRDYARTDEDFESIRDEPAFKERVRDSS